MPIRQFTMPALTLLMVLAMPPAPADAGNAGGDARQQAQQIIRERCQLCHGARGEASNAIYPRLAGQNRAYLERQLKLFRSGQRKSEIMNEQAANLSDDVIAALAAHFSAQPPLAHRLPRTPKKKLLHQVGRFVFLYGDPYADIPACRSCHGDHATGSETLPRLAGQHRKYILNQLEAFATGARRTDNAVMRSIASHLAPLAREAVALYLSTLNPEAAGKGGQRP